jgi:hypothetical protein
VFKLYCSVCGKFLGEVKEEPEVHICWDCFYKGREAANNG